MRIGLVCPYDLSRPGGVQAQVRDLARNLAVSGEEVTIVAPGLPDDIGGVNLGGTITIPGNRSKVPISPDPRVSRLIKKASTGLDLLHVHEPLMPMVSLSALRVGIPVVATFHAAPERFASAFYKMMGSRIRALLGPNVRIVTAVSRTAAAPLSRAVDVTIVPNGVDVERFGSDVARKPLRVVFLGRDEPRKGLDVLLEAWVEVSRINADAELLVMGADRGYPGVTWMGPVDDRDKIEGLCSSSIHVAPNLGGESFGLVLVEGMAAGAALVASDLEPFRDVGGEAARYFPAGNVEALAEALIDLLSAPSVVRRLAAAGRERARLYDWATVSGRYREVYEAALS